MMVSAACWGSAYLRQEEQGEENKRKGGGGRGGSRPESTTAGSPMWAGMQWAERRDSRQQGSGTENAQPLPASHPALEGQRTPQAAEEQPCDPIPREQSRRGLQAQRRVRKGVVEWQDGGSWHVSRQALTQKLSGEQALGTHAAARQHDCRPAGRAWKAEGWSPTVR